MTTVNYGDNAYGSLLYGGGSSVNTQSLGNPFDANLPSLKIFREGATVQFLRTYASLAYGALVYSGAYTNPRFVSGPVDFDDFIPNAGTLDSFNPNLPHGLGRIPSDPTVGDFYLSVTGSDSNPGTLAAPFLTFNKAYHAASPGQVVVVLPGRYPITNPGGGETYIDVDATKAGATQDVTFVTDGLVTFDCVNFTFRPGVHHVTMKGAGFRFQVVLFGYGGSTTIVKNITLDGPRLNSYDMPGAQNITVKNGQIGPVHQGYAPNTAGQSPGRWLVVGDPIEDFFARWPNGTLGQFIEPLIHNQSSNIAQNILFDNCWMTGNNVKDATNMHSYAMFVTNTNGLTVQNCVFDHNCTGNISTWETGSLDNVLIQNNVFGWPVYTLDPADHGGTGGEAIGFRELILGTTGLTYNNWLIRYNSFAHGVQFHGTVNNGRVVGNVLGNASSSDATGISFDHNVGFSGGNSFGGLDLGSTIPYADYANLNFQLNGGSAARAYVPWVGSDQQLATDINGAARSAPTNAGAYAT